MGNKTKIIGSKELVDPTTGEVIPCSLVQQDTYGRRNFYITYMYNIMKLFDVLGGKKYKVLEFIIDNMNYENQLIMTTREIEKKSGISKKTILETLKLLEENNLIVRKTGVVMLNPKLFNNKKDYQEQYMLIKYNQIKRESDSNQTNNDSSDNQIKSESDSNQTNNDSSDNQIKNESNN